jgi:hypothetical protein
MDHTPESCSEIDEKKLVRYRELLIQLQCHLPNWNILWAPFSVGVQGTILKTTWRRNFEILGIPADKQEGIMAEAVNTALLCHSTLLDSQLAANFADIGPGAPTTPLPRRPQVTTVSSKAYSAQPICQFQEGQQLCARNKL